MKACFSIYAKPNLSLNSFLQCEMIDFQTQFENFVYYESCCWGSLFNGCIESVCGSVPPPIIKHSKESQKLKRWTGK